MAHDTSFDLQLIDTKTDLDKSNQTLLDHWQALPSGNPETTLPFWKAYDPLKLPEIIPFSYFIHVSEQDDKPRFTYDLIGNKLASIYGEVTGQTLSEFESKSPSMARVGDRTRKILTEAVSKRHPVLAKGNLTFSVPDKTRFEMMVLPFVNKDNDISNLLATTILS